MGAGFLPLVGVMAVVTLMIYFIMVRPVRQRERQHDQMVDLLEKGDKVITASGMFAGDGHAAVDYTIPADTNLTGLEVYFQAAVRSGNQFMMTNPDRIVFD